MTFRRSTRSGGDNGSNCVEVALNVGAPTAALRDSKAPDAGQLRVPAASVAALVAHVTR